MLNVWIANFDDAVAHLDKFIKNIAHGYPAQDQDDISQACWLEAFSLVRARGGIDLALLIKHLAATARHENRALNSYGLTPRRSKHKSPNRQGVIPDTPSPCEAESTLQDMEIESTGMQQRIIKAINLLLGVGQRPTQNAIAEVLGVTRKAIRYQLEKIREKYDDDQA